MHTVKVGNFKVENKELIVTAFPIINSSEYKVKISSVKPGKWICTLELEQDDKVSLIHLVNEASVHPRLDYFYCSMKYDTSVGIVDPGFINDMTGRPKMTKTVRTQNGIAVNPMSTEKKYYIVYSNQPEIVALALIFNPREIGSNAQYYYKVSESILMTLR